MSEEGYSIPVIYNRVEQNPLNAFAHNAIPDRYTILYCLLMGFVECAVPKQIHVVLPPAIFSRVLP